MEALGRFRLQNQQLIIDSVKCLKKEAKPQKETDGRRADLPTGPTATVRFPPSVRFPPLVKASMALRWFRMMTRSDT